MDEFHAVLGVLGMFVLRLGVPLLVTALVVTWLRRLDERWQAEAEAQRTAQQTGAAPAPLVDPDRVLRPVAQPCWQIKRCAAKKYHRCPAYQQPDLPCWETRRRADGTLLQGCAICTIYQLRIHSHEHAYQSEAVEFSPN